MNGYEMEGFLRGNGIPGDLKVNESNAQYLVRKFSELQSQNADLAVQLANAESKCRKVAGVVAENADLKSLIEQHAGSIAVCPNCSHEAPSDTDDIVALYRSLKTPATDAFQAEVRAQGVEMFAAHCQKRHGEMMKSEPNETASNQAITATRRAGEFAMYFAAQLRKGVQS